MKILVVTQYFFPENFRVNDLVNGLVARGHEVTVLTGQPNYPGGRYFDGYGALRPTWETQLGAKVLRVPMIPRGKGGAVNLVLNYFSFAAAATAFVPFKLKGSFDAVFVFEVSPVTVALPAIVAARKFKAPILFWVLDLWPESLAATGGAANRRVLDWVRRGVKWIYSQCDQILVQSRAFIPSITAMGVPDAKLRYFPNWVEAEYEAAAETPETTESRTESAGEFRVVYAGNIGAAQDFPAIIEAAVRVARHLPNVLWTIAGDGRMADWVKAEVAARNLAHRFEFLGQLPPTRMPSLFASADALLVSLKPDPIFAITVPGKVQSYLASGRPVLAMLDGEGARVIEESGAGFAVPSGNAEALAQLVLKVAAMAPEERNAMGQRGRSYAQCEFGREGLFDKLESWLSEAAQVRHSTSL